MNEQDAPEIIFVPYEPPDDDASPDDFVRIGFRCPPQKPPIWNVNGRDLPEAVKP